MYTPDEINNFIKTSKGFDTNKVSDGYHTFGELYDHRIALFVALANHLWSCGDTKKEAWKSKLHADGSEWDGWFIAGIGIEKGKQISYHLPIAMWDKLDVLKLERAPEWDGHTSRDVLERLLTL